MIKGAIFDLDGTLVDSMFIWETFGKDYLHTLGKEPTENLTDLRKQRQTGGTTLCRSRKNNV